MTSACIAATMLLATPASAGEPPHHPAPVEMYPIHADGGLVYDPLRREAEKTGQLARYEGVPTREVTVELPPYTLRARVPLEAGAYDTVPILYELSSASREDWVGAVAVEATAFEDETRRAGRDLFDLALPGKIDLDIQFLGSVTAHARPDRRHNITADFTDESADVYPSYERRPFVRSGTVEAGDHVWFRFGYTNTGDTILDPEGFGGCKFHPQVLRKGTDGTYALHNNQHNMYVRDLEYLYPGETHEQWAYFGGLAPGEYRLRIMLVYRLYNDPETPLTCTQTGKSGAFVNQWGGPPAVVWEMPFTVAEEAADTPVAPGERMPAEGDLDDKITRFIHTQEEFMTSFDCHLAPPESGTVQKGVLHLQIAPWTEQVVLKVIATSPVRIKTAATPLAVSSDRLEVRYDPSHPAQRVKDGMLEPFIASQPMPDMRTHVPLGPWPERHIEERFMEMLDCGVNYVVSTSVPSFLNDMHRPPVNEAGDGAKYYLELCRREGIPVEAWSHCYFDSKGLDAFAGWILGRPLPVETVPNWYASHSLVDPNMAEAQAALWIYPFRRWGDLYAQTHRGDVPVGVEDSRGWMRQDISNRDLMGPAGMAAFREWTRDKYGEIAAVNAAWGTAFASFDEIDPEAGQKSDPFPYRYNDREHPFHDWNAAVEDFDRFRTELRVKNYRDILGIVREVIPDATVCIRNEGGNVLVAGIDPHDPDPHLRHIYYGQRRIGAIAEIIQESGLVKFHEDYTTVPYPPSLLGRLVRAGVEQGVIPIYLAQFCNMRDIVINERYGTDYTDDYNLPSPARGYMMHSLVALFPWYRTTLEAGGVPGILWEDYQCDGVATETQKREMRLFKEKLHKALDAPGMAEARRADPPDQNWREGARPMHSYVLAPAPGARPDNQAAEGRAH